MLGGSGRNGAHNPDLLGLQRGKLNIKHQAVNRTDSYFSPLFFSIFVLDVLNGTKGPRGKVFVTGSFTRRMTGMRHVLQMRVCVCVCAMVRSPEQTGRSEL